MSVNLESSGASLRSVLIVGCGLIGTSLAMAVRKACPEVVTDGVEPHARHREHALACGAFRTVFEVLPESATYDLAVLAVPVWAAAELLDDLQNIATWIMDVSSVKQPVCDAARRLGLASRFIPCHPMAGGTSAGPTEARADLFSGHPWLFLEGWPANDVVAAMVARLGARSIRLASEADHDAAMAAVSHGIHLTSLAAMTAYQQAADSAGHQWSAVTGPGFRDVTRLSGSPPDFWVQTLLSNKAFVTAHLGRIIAAISEFRSALETDDKDALFALLQQSRAAHARWMEERR